MLFNAKILVPSSLKVQKKFPSKQSSTVVAKYNNTLRLNLPLNDEKCQTLNLNVVQLDTGKIFIFNNLYIIHNNFEKKWPQDVLNFTTRDQLIDRLHFRVTRLCYSQRLDDGYTTLINVAEAYFLTSKRVSNNNIENKSIVSKFSI